MKRAKPLAWSLLFFVLLAAGCGARASTPGPDSETHFLACMSDAECLTGAICQCGLCMVQCASDTTCTAPAAACLAGPTCATSRPVTVCATRCQTDGDCAAGLVCSGDVCSVKSIAAPAAAATTRATPLSFETEHPQLAADGQDRLYMLGSGTVQAPPTAIRYSFLASFESDGSVRWSKEINGGQIAVNAAGEILLNYACPYGCVQHRNAAGDLEWTTPGSFQEMVEADGGSFWLIDGNNLLKWDRSGNELFKQRFPFTTAVNGVLKYGGPLLNQRGTLVWSEIQAGSGGYATVVRPVAGDLHRIAFPELANNGGYRTVVAADGAVVVSGSARPGGTLALSCREMLGALRWTLSTTLAGPDQYTRMSFHRNGNLLVTGLAFGDSTFGGHRVDGDPAVGVGLVAEVDMSSGAVVWLHRFRADPGVAMWGINPVVAPPASLSDGRIAALVNAGAGSATRLFLDDTLLLDGLAAPSNGALVIFKP